MIINSITIQEQQFLAETRVTSYRQLFLFYVEIILIVEIFSALEKKIDILYEFIC